MRTQKLQKFVFTLFMSVALVVLAVQPIGVQAQQTGVIRLGLLESADSLAGQGAQLAIAEINGSGGVTGPDGTVYGIELLSTPALTPDAVRAGLAALIEREVMAVLGPSDDALVLQTLNDLVSAQRPVFTSATSGSITLDDTQDFVFRARAPEQTYMQALVAYLTTNLQNPNLVIVREPGDVISASVTDFLSSLNSRGVAPASTIQLESDADLTETAATLAQTEPDVVAVWGAPENAASLLTSLRSAGWPGAFFYRQAHTAAFQDLLSPANAANVLGVTNWVPGVRSALSDDFLRNFVITFGRVPDGLSAAYYDAVYLLAAAVEEAGNSPSAVQQAMQGLDVQLGVQGLLNPGQFRIGEVTTAAAITELNIYAAPQILARFVNGSLVTGDGQGDEVVSAPPTATPNEPAVQQPTATPTIAVTPTLQGVWGVVTSFRLNVRSGPGTNYDIVGGLSVDDVVQPIGANVDFSWLVIPFRGTNAWIAASLLDLTGELNTLPIIQAPPSPTPEATATFTPIPVTPTPVTPSPQPFADLVVVSATFEPANPRVGQPFTVRTVVRNIGLSTSAETAVASSFMPGDVYSSATIPPLVPGQQADLTLTATVNGAGTYSVALVVDLNNLVAEGSVGENNNLFQVTYTVLNSIITSGSRSLAPGQSADINEGDLNDVTWDGAILSSVGNARIVVLGGVNWDTMTAAQVTGVGSTSLAMGDIPAGTVIGVLTNPNQVRAAIRVDSYNGTTINFSYKIFG